MMKTLILLLCPLLFICSDSGQSADEISPIHGSDGGVSAVESSLSNKVREIIAPRCGSCHTSTLATAKPEALKVFDLVRPDWSSTMSGNQLRAFGKRLSSLEDLEKHIIDRFVAAESQNQETNATHNNTTNH